MLIISSWPAGGSQQPPNVLGLCGFVAHTSSDKPAAARMNRWGRSSKTVGRCSADWWYVPKTLACYGGMLLGVPAACSPVLGGSIGEHLGLEAAVESHQPWSLLHQRHKRRHVIMCEHNFSCHGLQQHQHRISSFQNMLLHSVR